MNTGLMKNLKKKKKGFTLIELIIVIAIIAILAAIAIPKFGTVKQDANVAADKANGKNISLAVAKGIAEDELSATAGTYDLDKLPGVSGDYDIGNLVDGVSSSTNGKTKGYTKANFQVVIDAKANIKVLLGTDEVYPDNTNSFKAKDEKAD